MDWTIDTGESVKEVQKTGANLGHALDYEFKLGIVLRCVTEAV